MEASTLLRTSSAQKEVAKLEENLFSLRVQNFTQEFLFFIQNPLQEETFIKTQTFIVLQ